MLVKEILQPLKSVYLQTFFQNFALLIKKIQTSVLVLPLFFSAFSLLILILFRFLVGFVVWIVLVGVVLACCIGTVILWYLNQHQPHEK